MNDFFTRVENVVDEVEQEQSPLTLAALVLRADSEAQWLYDFIVSAPWMIERGKAWSYTYLKQKLSKFLEKEDWTQISRMLVMNPKEEFIQELQRMTGSLGHDISNQRIAGIDVRLAHVFVSNSNLESRVAQVNA